MLRTVWKMEWREWGRLAKEVCDCVKDRSCSKVTYMSTRLGCKLALPLLSLLDDSQNISSRSWGNDTCRDVNALLSSPIAGSEV